MKSDAEDLMPRLLPVEEDDTEDVDPSIVPRNPKEYLRQVQLEASRCPDVVVAQIDPKKLKKKQTVNVSLSGCHAAPEGFSPSLSWQRQQVSNFSTVRQSVNKHRQHWKMQTLDENVIMPNPDDEEGWKKFCLGENVYCERTLTHDDNESMSPSVDYVKVGFPPLLSIVSRFSQVLVTTVLEHLISWFGERDFCPELGRWLYALLACLEKPLLPEAHSLIRQLARRCSEVRAKIHWGIHSHDNPHVLQILTRCLTTESKEDENVSALNLLICLVARYFEQNDLADKE